MSALLAALFAYSLGAPPSVQQRSPLWTNRWQSAIDPRPTRAAQLADDAEQALEESAIRQAEVRQFAQRATSARALQQELLLARRLLDVALRDARGALAIDPRQPRALFVLARAREQLDATPQEVVTLANAALAALPERDSDRRSMMYFSLGVAHTRLEQHALARDAYLRIVSDASAPSRATALCNLAEVHMYLNEVDDSISRYHECARLLPTNATAWWGLAVAHDRAGHDADARTSADHAVSMDPDLRDIEGEGVFYVPDFERYYYLAVAREAQGRRGGAIDTTMAALVLWQRYLAEGGPRAPWAARVRTHIQELERALAARVRDVPRASRAPRAGDGRR